VGQTTNFLCRTTTVALEGYVVSFRGGKIRRIRNFRDGAAAIQAGPKELGGE
jgi:hypothetical protein